MDLIVFDLDGTLLNSDSKISAYTGDTLLALREREIAYTVATGRTFHSATELIADHAFTLPQVFKNGVMIWDPAQDHYSHQNFLSLDEIAHVIDAMLSQSVTPFVFTLEPGNRHGIYHAPLVNDFETRLAEDFARHMGIAIAPIATLPAEAEITNISALGKPERIESIVDMISNEPGLVSYSGVALEGKALRWLDIHHSNASKGNAIDTLRDSLGAATVLCFGDSDNDLSMFARADESYATENAKTAIKAAADAVIGHHNDDGVARFLRERFNL